MRSKGAFDTHLLDQGLLRRRELREKRRKERLEEVFHVLKELSDEVPFREAYIFGSLAKPFRFFDDSDIDIAFVGLKDEDFFQTMAFLSRKLASDVDVIQLEEHPLEEKIMREGIRWMRRG